MYVAAEKRAINSAAILTPMPNINIFCYRRPNKDI